jgi:hypothetical protein
VKVGSITPNELDAALVKHGTAVNVILAEDTEHWPIGLAMRLFAMMAKEIASAEHARRNKKRLAPPNERKPL